MDTSYHYDAARHVAESRPTRQVDRDLKIVRQSVRETAAPAVEFGSGWYHDEAITQSHDLVSHRSM